MMHKIVPEDVGEGWTEFSLFIPHSGLLSRIGDRHRNLQSIKVAGYGHFYVNPSLTGVGRNLGLTQRMPFPC